MSPRQTAVEIFLAGVESVKPDNLIKRYVYVNGDILQIEEISLRLSDLKNIYIVGAGKASAPMALAMEDVLGTRITDGHIVTKYGHSSPLRIIKTTEAGHPVPDDKGILGTDQILSLVSKAEKDDLVICLISGGGSALLTDVPEGCGLEDLKRLSDVLLKSGANISEINCIRKHLSLVKGGQLAKAASPARVVSLILSDVIGDPLDVIASGPTAADPTTFKDAISILERYDIGKEIPEPVRSVLYDGLRGNREETLKESDEILSRTFNLIIGTNLLSLKVGKEKAESFGYDCKVVTNRLAGDVNDVATFIINEIKAAREGLPNHRKCLLFAGEPTVKVTGTGLGGRNQHLALIIARSLKNLPDVVFLSGGTDGNDGPTDAAGAVVDSFTNLKATELHLDVESFIKNHDSYNFFRQEGGLIVTGPTKTNVMDLMVALVN